MKYINQKETYNRQQEKMLYRLAVDEFYHNLDRQVPLTIEEHLRNFEDIFNIKNEEHWYEYGTD